MISESCVYAVGGFACGAHVWPGRQRCASPDTRHHEQLCGVPPRASRQRNGEHSIGVTIDT